MKGLSECWKPKTSGNYSEDLLIRMSQLEVRENHINNGMACNVTTRRQSKSQTTNMASLTSRRDGDDGGSILIDSILTQTEECEIRKMLDLEEDLMGSELPFSSTQMGGTAGRKTTFHMSPIMRREYHNPSCNGQGSEERGALDISNRFGIFNSETYREEINTLDNRGGQNIGEIREIGAPNNINVDSKLTPATGGTLHDLGPGDAAEEPGDRALDDTDTAALTGSGEVDGVRAGLSKEAGGENQREGESDSNEDGGAEDEVTNLDQVTAKLGQVDKLLSTLGNKSVELNDTVIALRESLEFSQKEIDTLKEENGVLKQKLTDLETEERRSVYQMDRLEEKVDRVETQGKRKIFEGISEVGGVKEDVERTIWTLFDQLKINRRMDLDACYRQGSFNKNRNRPILITFQTQADRDFVYSSRMDLRKTQDYKNVWINEDLGLTSKKTRNMIRLISKQAGTEGIDCRTGKYMIQLGREKFDAANMNELPPPLHPSNVKQIRVDDHTIAYQSEYAPFSNLYPTKIKIGQYTFISLEQAFQFLKAKKMNKLLAATRIYLSRNQVEIKQLGDELSTSDLWEEKKMDIMYICLKHKFEQNHDLLDMLLKTGDCELVEATPNKLWGCGATLSSNLLRRHEWTGENRQGRTLMTVREELRQTWMRAAEMRKTD